MTKKLIWLWDRKDSKNSHEAELAVGALKEKQWQVMETQDVSVLEREVQLGGASLAVVSGDLSGQELQKWQAFSQRYKKFPTFFFQSDVVDKMPGEKSPWSYVYKEKFQQREFLQELESFAVYATAEQERRQALILINKMEHLSRCLDIRDTNMAVVNVLNFFQSDFQCENVFWFKSGELAKSAVRAEQKEPQSFVSLEDIHHSSCPMMASRPFDVEVMGRFFQKIVQSLPEDWQEASDFQEFEMQSRRCCLLPVLSQDVGKVIGHFLLVDGVSVGESWLAEAVAKVQELIGRHFTYCLQFEVLKSLTYMDHLTHLFNQRYLPIVLDREINRVERYGSRFSVLFMDIDRFKSVNDNHGHLVGSGIISQMGDVLQGCLRESDYGFRFGGDEFVMVLVETGVEQARLVAERIRQTIEDQVFEVIDSKHRITVSIGVSTCPEHAKTKEEILAMADEAMYYGKNTTKNVVYVAS